MLITHSKITRTALIDLTDNSVIKSWAGNVSGKVEIPGKGIKANLQRGQQWDNYRVVAHEVLRDEEPGMRRFQKLSETKRRYLKADNTLREIQVYSWIPDKDIKQIIDSKLSSRIVKGSDEANKATEDKRAVLEKTKDRAAMIKFYCDEVAT
jgi:hypothetical protein